MEVHDYMAKEPHALEPALTRLPGYERPWLSEDLSNPVVHWPLFLSADEEDITFFQTLYREEIRYFDGQFGELVRGLEELGLLQSTVIVLTSDHGEGFDPGNGRITHAGRLHEDLVHVPLIVAGPDLPAGVSLGRPISLVDVAPTLLGLGHLEIPTWMNGQALFELTDSRWSSSAAGLAQEQQRQIFYEETFFAIDRDGMRVPITRDVRGNTVEIFGVRVGSQKYVDTDVKLVRTDGSTSLIRKRELYDLAQDPYETERLLDEEAQGRFASVLEGIRATLPHGCPGAATEVEGVDPELLELLESLGYVQ
jgi:arylsulfatase A-like enzyme